MGDRVAFFYGTLMAPEILYRVIYGTSEALKDPIMAPLAASLTIVPALLKDFCRHRVKDADYPGIIPEKGHTVKGTFVSGLTDGDIYRLDAFEGSEYDRVWVSVELTDESGNERGIQRKSETYVYTYGDDNLEKMEWDYEEFRKEKLQNWTVSSREYEDVDRADAQWREETETALETSSKQEEVLRSAV